MPIQFLQTKLNIPQMNNHIIQRCNLSELLNKADEYKLILVSSPAGSGKSTIIADHVTMNNLNCSWYSLDKSDDDLLQFSSYLVKGMEKNKELEHIQFQELIDTFQSIGEISFIKAIIQVLQSTTNEFTIIFDDYHMIQLQTIHNMMIQLLEYLPSNIHVIIITREDPPLPLSKWRVKNQLLEIRVNDLKFNDSEARNFLNQTMKLQLSEHEVHILNNRTEGWIAGLQLTALFIKGHQDKAQFVADFSGNHYYIMDYLLEEVLHQQTSQIKEFLLCTSILDRFCSSLCDDVIGLEKGTSQKILEILLRANAFIIPLDYQHYWFRYHHLFSDLLRQKLTESDYSVKKLHKNASRWFYQNGSIIEAIHHAFCAEDKEFAADLIESIWAEMDQALQGNQWLKLVKKLPDHIVRQRPVLNIGYAWALIDIGDLESCLEPLEEAQKQIDESEGLLESKKIVVYDHTQYKLLPAHIASAYAYISAAKGNSDEVFSYANRALSLIGEENKHRIGVVQMLLSFSYWADGALDEALKTVNIGLANIVKAGSPLSLSTFQLVIAELKIEMGNLKEAETILNQSIELLQSEDKLPLALASLYLKLCEIFMLRGNAERATEFLKISREKGDQFALPDFEHKWYLMQARLLAYQKMYSLTIDSLEKARRYYYMNPIPEHISIDGLKTEALIKLNQLENCTAFVNQETYLTEQDKIVYIKYLISMYKKDRDESTLINAESLLDYLLERACQQNRKRSKIDLSVLKAVIVDLRKDRQSAITILKNTMDLAATEEYMFPFINDYEHLLEQYQDLLNRKELPRFLVKQIVDMNNEGTSHTVIISGGNSSDILSQREMEVLKLLAQGYSNQDICDKLFLALSTVKGYNRSIFDKLEVKRRTEAIAKAREYRLID